MANTPPFPSPHASSSVHLLENTPLTITSPFFSLPSPSLPMSAQSRRATGSAAASTGPASDASANTASSTPTATAAHPRRRSLLPTSTAQPSPTPPLARRVSNPRAPRPPTNPPHPLPPPADSAPHDSMDLDDPTLSLLLPPTGHHPHPHLPPPSHPLRPRLHRRPRRLRVCGGRGT